MSKVIDKYISEKNIGEALSECLRNNQNYLGYILGTICLKSQHNVKFLDYYSRLAKNIEGMQKDNLLVDINQNNDGGDNSLPMINNDNECELLREKKNDEVVKESVSFVNESSDVVVGVIEDNSVTRVRLVCNWTDSKKLCDLWNKMSENNNYTWGSVKIVWGEPFDYTVVINCPPINVFPDPKSTIVFRMEPYMENKGHMWGDWSTLDKNKYLFIGYHSEHYNNNEWHLGKTYQQLNIESVNKDNSLSNVLSTVLSSKYNDSGHVKRIDFMKYVESKEMDVHTYGSDKFKWKNYKGELPYHKKDNALFPYKYTFNVENNSIKNYFTEKVIDGILAECLVFYNGCFNLCDFLPSDSFVYLELSNFEKDYNIIKKAIEEDWHSKRLPAIREAKKLILNELQFFPRLERIVKKDLESKTETTTL
jgi:hypothetical protein